MSRWLLVLFAICAQAGLLTGARAQTSLNGHWRIVDARQAPWAAGPPQPMPFERSGLHIAADALRGPDPLICSPLKIERMDVPLPGLFEGALPSDRAEAMAASLGLSARPPGVPSFRLTCPNASFDLHGLGADRFLFLLDGVVYTARRVDGIAASRTAAFLLPAWPALECSAPPQAWQRLTCAYPETAAAHAAMAQMLRMISRSAGDGGKAFAAAQARFLAATAQDCRIAAGKLSEAESFARAECLRKAFDERVTVLATGLH